MPLTAPEAAFLGSRIDRWAGGQSAASDVGLYAAPVAAYTAPTALPLSTEAIGAALTLGVTLSASTALASSGLDPGDPGALVSSPSIADMLNWHLQTAAAIDIGLALRLPKFFTDEGGTAHAASLGFDIDEESMAGAAADYASTPTGGDAPIASPDAVSPLPAAIAPVLEAVQASTNQLQEALAALSGLIQPAPAGALAPIAALQEEAASVLAHIDDLTKTASADVAGVVAETLAPVTVLQQEAAAVAGEANDFITETRADIVNVVSDALTPVSTLQQEVAETLDQVGGVVEQTAQAVSSVADISEGVANNPIVTQLPDLVEAAQANVSAIASTAVQSAAVPIEQATGTASTIVAEAAQTLASVGDIADGALSGVDPAGGVETLVSMVSAADLFQLHDDALSQTEVEPAAGALGLADTLAEIAPVDALLGAHLADGGLLGHAHSLLDDHHMGLG